jgi:hypothetical protein
LGLQPQSGTDLDGVRGIGGEPGDQQALMFGRTLKAMKISEA